MSIVNQKTIDDINLARKIISQEDISIVVIKNQDVLEKKKGLGIRPILEIVDEMGEKIEGCIIGDRILGRASSLLCRYAKVGGVYSPQGTKTAIALLIMGGIPCQVDRLIPKIMNRDGDGSCPFEKLLKDVVSPDEAYKLINDKIKDM